MSGDLSTGTKTIINKAGNRNIYMEKKIWIIPIAGNGTRTSALGEFKPFIIVHNKRIMEWFINSIIDKISPEDTFFFISTQYFNQKFSVETAISELYAKYNLQNKLQFIFAPETPQGPAKSVSLALDFTEDETPIIVINADQFMLFKLPETIGNKCYLVSNIDIGESKSYIKLQDKKITRIVEKNNISNIASAGAYIFPNNKLLQEGLDYIFDNHLTCKNEYFISTAMDCLIEKVDFELIPAIAKLDLGTVQNIEYFDNLLTHLI